MTVAELIAARLDAFEGSPGVRTDYERVFALLPDWFLVMSSDKVRPIQIDRLYAQLAATLSPHRIGRIADLIGPAFDRALRLDLIASNPCTPVPRPAIPDVEETEIPTPERVAEILGFLSGWMRVAAHVAATTGARRGELAALKWDHIDLDRGTIAVLRGAVVIPRAPVLIRETKTGKRGRRTVSIDADTVELLEGWRDVAPPVWVFGTKQGGPRRPDVVTQSWSKALRRQHRTQCKAAEAAGEPLPEFEPLHFHSLRHFSATTLLAAGVAVHEVSRRLGHATTAITQDRYGHLIPERDRMAADVLGASLRAGRG